ncbi:LysR family transcriptional regulator [Acetobacter pasteurianus NBRC 3280]|uniref:LysR family transcriptional regulator n=1 Tax=Acetobacter pasteurianus NBRC 3278 TaxID=1226660 RepID=A0A401X624_ACEPA|nr:LysR family transcriptional regulator [Acetobacter pasteurianus]GCD59906.1 LysR family transcriptional regulator [Acetobacter pasteurianus NBRC 3277]GCD63128.1 LysR family transcriptional regulator [Acetobacter pasteurianus NBRC 3278]GCD69866.1 LysR family transcriptional regulator [Acetobacter pasteurianus NBRC 3280]
MEQSLISLERMRTFVRVAERGNLAAVALETGTGPSTITRHLRELEEGLGVSLLTRTTRRTALTDEGARYYAHCVQILSLVEQASQEMRDTRQATAGTVRISCTGALGVLHFGRLIYEFQDRNPGIRVEFGLTDERIDLVREGVDIAIRLGPLTDCAMKLRSLGESGRLLVASPEWLRRHGPVRLVLRSVEGRNHVVPFHGRLVVDHGLAARDAFLAGRGYGPAHRWLVEDCLRDGRLEQLLPDYTLPAVPLSMLIAPERTNLTRVRLCIEFLTLGAREIPGIR